MSELQEVLTALTKRYGFEVVQPTLSTNKIRVLGRIQEAQERNWMVGIEHLLTVADGRAWNVDVSRQYFLRGPSLVYAWRLIIQAPELEQHVDDIVTTLNNAPRAKFQVEEQALPVRGRRSTMNANGKGASSAGTLPSILQRKVGG